MSGPTGTTQETEWLWETPTIGIAAHPRLRNGPRSPLVRLFKEFEPFLTNTLRPRLVAVKGTALALRRHGLFQDFAGLEPLSLGGRGGFVELAERVVQSPGSPSSVDHVIYLIDPLDPTSLYPETQAIKRECVVKHKFFASTYGAAHEWLTLLWLTATASSAGAQVEDYFIKTLASGPTNAVALIAHDTKKADMLDFVLENFPLLDSFQERLSTGTTGSLLNGKLPDRLIAEWREIEAHAELFATAGIDSPETTKALGDARALQEKVEAWRQKLKEAGRPGDWVTRLQTGREGGDVQVAARILGGPNRRCGRVFFFEDPLVSREHETDIQVFERAARIPEIVTACYHDRVTATTWAKMRATAGWDRRSIVREFGERFDVYLVLSPHSATDESRDTWHRIVDAASWFLFGEIVHLARIRPALDGPLRVGVSWGFTVRQLVDGIQRVAADESRRDNDPLTIPNNIRVLPVAGLMGHTQPFVEANANAASLARLFNGTSIAAPYYTFVDSERWTSTVKPNQDLLDWSGEWDQLDLAMFTVCRLSEKFGRHRSVAGLPAEMYESLLHREAVGEIGGMFLRQNGEEVTAKDVYRLGIEHSSLRGLADRGGAVLVAGAESTRRATALAAVKGGLVSVLVTDVAFARSLLEASRKSDYRPSSGPGGPRRTYHS